MNASPRTERRASSGTIASAEIAARDAPIPVIVVDTGTVSFGVAACVRAAREAGGTPDEASEAATQLGRRIKNAFVARAGPHGRISAQPGWALLRFVDGTTTTIDACESIRDAVAEMAKLVLRDSDAVAAAVGHAGKETEAPADELAHAVFSAGTTSVERYRVGAPVGAHTGPESFGVFWWSTP
jgi:fatty acid-binding protein DegV